METTIINKFGTMQGWNCITFNWMGRDVEGFTKIHYDDTIPKENVYAGSRYPIGRSEGNYAATFGFTLLKEEVDALRASLPPGVRIQDMAPSDPVIEYALKSGVILKDRVRNVEVITAGVEVSQGDGTIEVEFECICSHIDWNVL